MRTMANVPTPPMGIRRSAIRRGLQVFAALSILGLLVLFWVSRPAGVLDALSRLKLQYLALGVGLSTVDCLGGGTAALQFRAASH